MFGLTSPAVFYCLSVFVIVQWCGCECAVLPNGLTGQTTAKLEPEESGTTSAPDNVTVPRDFDERLRKTRRDIGVAVCEQAVDKGRCRARHTRWYFDSITQECQQFYFGGCEGNSNNFPTKWECMSVCSTLPSQVDRVTRLKSDVLERCQQPLTAIGLNQIRWYYDRDNDECLQFTYAGCGGNLNNFESTADCEIWCKGVYGPRTSELLTPFMEEAPCAPGAADLTGASENELRQRVAVALSEGGYDASLSELVVPKGHYTQDALPHSTSTLSTPKVH